MWARNDGTETERTFSSMVLAGVRCRVFRTSKYPYKS